MSNEEMIRKYVEAHTHVWLEIIEGQRQGGYLEIALIV